MKLDKQKSSQIAKNEARGMPRQKNTIRCPSSSSEAVQQWTGSEWAVSTVSLCFLLPCPVRTGLCLPGAKRIGHRTHVARVAVACRTAAHLFDRTQHGSHVWKEVEVEEVEVEVEKGGCARCMGPVAE